MSSLTLWGSGCTVIDAFREAAFDELAPGHGGLEEGATAVRHPPLVLRRNRNDTAQGSTANPPDTKEPPALGTTPNGAPSSEPVAAPQALTQTSNNGSIRFIVVGDTGEGNGDQHAVAAAIARDCKKRHCDALFHTGDIIYPSGIASRTDPALQTHFLNDMKAIGVPIWLSLGNHDYQGNVDAWIDAFGDDPAPGAPQVHMPARYYTTQIRGVRLVVIDSNSLTDAQGRWLDRVLAESRAAGDRWVLVVGHHPWVSGGLHGHPPRGMAQWYAKHLCGRADIYLAGHDHDKQILLPQCDIALVVSGAGSKLRRVRRIPETRFAASTLGWASVEIQGDDAVIRFHDVRGRTEVEQPLRRDD